MSITITQYVVDRTEYVNPTDPAGPHLFRLTISDVAPASRTGPSMTKMLDGISAADAATFAPGTQLDVAYTVHAA